MISIKDFQHAVMSLFTMGYAIDDIVWAETIKPPASPEVFAREAAFVIANSGMKNSVARGIYRRCMHAIEHGKSASTVFGHAGKAAAMDLIWARRKPLYEGYLEATDKIEYLLDLPWIGGITVYHLAKNFGADVVKADVHLQRLADLHQVTPTALCADLARQTGWKLPTIDTLLWRACANGIINSRTGEVKWIVFDHEKNEPPPWDKAALNHGVLQAAFQRHAELTVCRGCRCDDDHACHTPDGPCSWAVVYGDHTGLCSACANTHLPSAPADDLRNSKSELQSA